MKLLTMSTMLLLAVQMLHGCGGGNTSMPRASQGSIGFTVHWPARTRLIPIAANSIRIDATTAAGIVNSSVIARVTSQDIATALVHLPTTKNHLVITARPDSAGLGNPEASAETDVNIVADQTVQVQVTLQSTIDHVVITPTPIVVPIGQTVSVSAAAYDASNQIVLTDPLKWQWALSQTTAVLINPSGSSCQVTRSATGSPTLTAQETESGKSFTASISVGSLYHVTDLSPIGGDTSYAFALNNSNQIVGSSTQSSNSGTIFAAYWSAPGQPAQSIGLPGNYGGGAISINSSGQVVGTSSLSAQNVFVWSSGNGPQNIGLPGGATNATGVGMNDSGSVVGNYGGTQSGSGAFSWSLGGGFAILPTYNGSYSIAAAINNSGTVVGQLSGPLLQPFVWNPGGGITVLPPLSGLEGAACAINANGDIVGWALPTSAATNQHATLWLNSGTSRDLGTLDGDAQSIANGINDSGQIVGSSTSIVQLGYTRAFIWTSQGGMRDLNTLLDSASVGWHLSYAFAINNQGCIVGYGTNPEGKTHGFSVQLTASSQ